MELIVVVFFLWLAYLGFLAVRHATRVTTDVGKRVVYGAFYCLVCGEPNGRVHGCHISAVARRGAAIKGGYHMRNGMVKRWRWEGYVYDRLGDVWRCRHNHWTREEAKACASNQVRRFQLTGEGLPQVALPRPETCRVPRRVPIADLSDAKWARLKAEYGNACAYCGTPGVALEKEHKMPLSRGGANNAANIVPACKPCNLRKGVLSDEEYRRRLLDDAERERLLKSRRGNITVSLPHVPPAPVRHGGRFPDALLARLATRRTPWVEHEPQPELEPALAKPRKRQDSQATDGTKRCTSCRALLPLSAFGSHKGKSDGRNNRCRDCARAATKRWQAENSQKAREARAKARRAARERNKAAGGMAESKTCSQCRQHRPASEFHRDAGSPDGLQRRCIWCRKNGHPPTKAAD